METKYNNAKVAFLYCLSMIALGFLASGIGTALFSLIDKLLPQVGSGFYPMYNSGALKYAISAVIVSGPLYFWLMYLLRRGLQLKEYLADSGPRRWLTYLLLLASSVTIVGSLVRILYNFLDGDLTARFGLKALTVLILAGLIFGYYFYDLRNEAKEKDLFVRILLAVALVLTIGSLIISVVFGESPKVARAKRIDQQTIYMLDRVENAINTYYFTNKKAPADINELLGDANSGLIMADFENKDNQAKVEYKLEAEDKFQLCVKFELATDEQQLENDYTGRRWQHKQGDNCFTKTIEASRKDIDAKPLPLKD